MSKEGRSRLLRILDEHREKVINTAVDWVFNASVDLHGRRPRSETKELTSRLFSSYRDIIAHDDYNQLDRLMEYAARYRGREQFQISTILRGLLSFKKGIAPLLVRECDEPGVLLETTDFLDSVYEYSVFRMSDLFQKELSSVLTKAAAAEERATASIC